MSVSTTSSLPSGILHISEVALVHLTDRYGRNIHTVDADIDNSRHKEKLAETVEEKKTKIFSLTEEDRSFAPGSMLPLGTHGHDVLAFGHIAITEEQLWYAPSVELTVRDTPDPQADIRARAHNYAANMAEATARIGGKIVLDDTKTNRWILMMLTPVEVVHEKFDVPEEWVRAVINLVAYGKT